MAAGETVQRPQQTTDRPKIDQARDRHQRWQTAVAADSPSGVPSDVSPSGGAPAGGSDVASLVVLSRDIPTKEPTKERRGRDRARPGLLVLLVAATTMGQVGINIALPSIPALAMAFETSPGLAELSLTSFVVALAFSQLFWGPLSDSIGRRRVILIGATIYLVATGVCIVAPGIGVLIAARAVQGIGAGAGLVIGRAGIGDTFTGGALMRASGHATIAIGIVPAVAPIVGGALQDGVGWRGGYAATLVFAAIVLLALWLGLPESNRARRREVVLSRALSDYGAVFRSRSFVGYALANALGLGALYAFYTGSPGLFIEINHLSPSVYGAVLVGNSAAFILGSILTTRLSGDRSGPIQLRIASLTMLLGSGLLFVFVTVADTSLPTVIFGAYLFALGLGMTLPVGFAAALAMFEERKGTAAAALGCLQLAVAALASAMVSLLGAGAATQFPVIMCLMVVISLPCCWWIIALRPAGRGVPVRGSP